MSFSPNHRTRAASPSHRLEIALDQVVLEPESRLGVFDARKSRQVFAARSYKRPCSTCIRSHCPVSLQTLAPLKLLLCLSTYREVAQCLSGSS